MRKHDRFRLSHLMPNSWFYKLRDDMKIRPQNQWSTTAARSSSQWQYYHGATAAAAATPRPLPLPPPPPPPRKSYRGQTKQQQQRAPLESLQPKVAAELREFLPEDHHRLLSRRRSAGGGGAGAGDEFPGLQLRPIRTRPAASTVETSAAAAASVGDAACPSSPRLRSRKSHVLTPSVVVRLVAGGSTYDYEHVLVARRRRSEDRGASLSIVVACR